ncbi:TraY domain-containing protein [Vibrio hepatarius]|uniref:TraY domain-containing protein n=1 Tax=Vibrio hepatarius TaxID=171383 RepID=UPI00142DB77A|nr:TraY domain-containing protein [Vibrio hepatarius]NIY83727.1 TraY domain-containing protein [Vibrio hepatarius]
MKDGTLSSINLILDSETTQALEKAANKSFRTLRKEASLRVIDHVIRFSAPCSTRLCNESSGVKVHIPITLKAKQAPCLYRGNYRVKTYVEECSRRLKDHLQRYPTISAVGIVQEHTHAP